MITVVWFRQDLRVHDQPLLHRAAALGAPVVPLYVLPAHWTVPGPEGEDRLGAPKSAFLEECLADLSLSLEALGLALVTVVASPVTLLDDWHQRENPALCGVGGRRAHALLDHHAQAHQQGQRSD